MCACFRYDTILSSILDVRIQFYHAFHSICRSLWSGFRLSTSTHLALCTAQKFPPFVNVVCSGMGYFPCSILMSASDDIHGVFVTSVSVEVSTWCSTVLTHNDLIVRYWSWTIIRTRRLQHTEQNEEHPGISLDLTRKALSLNFFLFWRYYMPN